MLILLIRGLKGSHNNGTTVLKTSWSQFPRLAGNSNSKELCVATCSTSKNGNWWDSFMTSPKQSPKSLLWNWKWHRKNILKQHVWREHAYIFSFQPFPHQTLLTCYPSLLPLVSLLASCASACVHKRRRTTSSWPCRLANIKAVAAGGPGMMRLFRC